MPFHWQWRDISELEKLACLTELKIRRNPLTKDMEPENFREQLVARIGGLKSCNSGAVSIEGFHH